MSTELGYGERRVVDAHHHLWNIAENPYPWMRDAGPGTLEEKLANGWGHYEAAEYRRDVAAWNVAATVHVQGEWDARDPVGETRWLQAHKERHGIPDVIVGTARLEAPDVRETLLAHSRHAAFRGIRQILCWAEDPELSMAPSADLMTDRAWRAGFALLEPLGMSFDLGIFPSQMAEAAALAAAFPVTSIVLCHTGEPEQAGTSREQWRDGMRRLAACENVTVKLSGISSPQRSVEQIQEYVEEALAIFGCERAMFGSNLPVEHLEGSAQALVDAIRRALARRSQAERDAVWGATAARVYRLTGEQSAR